MKPLPRTSLVEVDTPSLCVSQAKFAPLASLPSQRSADPVIAVQKSESAVPVVPNSVSDEPTARLVVDAVVAKKAVDVEFVVVELPVILRLPMIVDDAALTMSADVVADTPVEG